MKVSHRFAPDSAVFDDDNLVSCAGLVLVMTLAERTGLVELLAEKVQIAEPNVKRVRRTRRRSWPRWSRGRAPPCGELALVLFDHVFVLDRQKAVGLI